MKNLHLSPYIGITGFTNIIHVFNTIKIYPTDTNIPKIMVGILVNNRSLDGLPVAEELTKKYPQRDVVSGLFSKHKNAMNIIHYSTNDPEHFMDQLLKMVYLYSYGNYEDNHPIIGKLHGFQFNMMWPDPKILDEFKGLVKEKKFKFILQIGKSAFDSINNSHIKLSEKLKEYSGIIDYVLLDRSEGNGEEMDIDFMYDYISAIYHNNQDINISIAGGLSAKSLGDIEHIIVDFPEISIDAEGKLRDNENNLDLTLARDYLKKALSIYQNTVSN